VKSNQSESNVTQYKSTNFKSKYSLISPHTLKATFFRSQCQNNQNGSPICGMTSKNPQV